MRKPIRIVSVNADGAADGQRPVLPASAPMEWHMELDQLLAIAELCAIARNLTRHQKNEIRSLASWLQGWQLREAQGLHPAVLQFIRDCACECLGNSRGGVPLQATTPLVRSARIH